MRHAQLIVAYATKYKRCADDFRSKSFCLGFRPIELGGIFFRKQFCIKRTKPSKNINHFLPYFYLLELRKVARNKSHKHLSCKHIIIEWGEFVMALIWVANFFLKMSLRVSKRKRKMAKAAFLMPSNIVTWNYASPLTFYEIPHLRPFISLELKMPQE